MKTEEQLMKVKIKFLEDRVKVLCAIHMTPQTESEVSRVAKQTRPERELSLIMEMEIFAPYNVRTIGSGPMELMLSITLVE